MGFIFKVVLSFIMFGIGGIVFPKHVQFAEFGNLVMVSSGFITIGYLAVASGVLSVAIQKKVTRGRIKFAIITLLSWIPIALFLMSTLMDGFSINGILTYILLSICGYYIFYLE